MIDLHFHIIPGVDDGPDDLEAAVALARAAVDVGVETVVATPHVSWDWQNSMTAIAEGVQRVETRLAELSIPLRVLPGAEIALTRAVDLSDYDLRALSLGGGPWLLIELPQMSFVAGLEAQLLHLQERGHRIVLAHVERCPTFLDDVRMLRRFTDAGMLASLTASALSGRFGKGAQRFSHQAVGSGLIGNVASDAHDCVRRPPGIASHLAGAGLASQIAWLTQLVPAAVLGSTEIPPPPKWPPLDHARSRFRWVDRRRH